MPQATICTKSSSGRGSVSSTCSMLNGANLSRATAAVICIRAILLCEGLLEIAVLVLGRIDDHLLVPAQVLLDTAALHVLKLDHEYARLRPLAELVEPDLADDGVERVRMDVGRELCVIEAAGRLDGLLQYLHCRIGERWLIEAEGVDPGILRLRLEFFQKLVNSGKIHLRAGNVEMVVHDAIDLLAELRDERGILHAHHGAAE